MNSTLSNFVEVYAADLPSHGILNDTFGGLFSHPIIYEIARVSLTLSLLATLLFLVAGIGNRNTKYFLASELTSAIAFFSLTILTFGPWDELFINLRHSVNLALYNKFSFNHSVNLEGTVDFLPYFLIGLLGKLKLPIVEMAFLQSFSGGAAAILAIRYLYVRFGISPLVRSLSMAVLFCYPPLVFNSSSGFATTTLAAAILWSTILYFFTPERRMLALVVLSVVPLIRIEGTFLVALVFIFQAYFGRSKGDRVRHTKLAGECLATLVPIGLLTLIRMAWFDSPMPIPIQYKDTLGNLSYLGIGLRNAFRDAWGTYLLVTGPVFLIGMILKIDFRIHSTKKSLGDLRYVWLLLLLLAIPYYCSGGDWFPSWWARYLFPISLFSLGLVPIVLTRSWSDLPKAQKWVPSAALALLLMGNTLGDWSIFPESEALNRKISLFTNSFSALRATAISAGISPAPPRIQMLSSLGTHLKLTTDNSRDAVASSEVASIMYFAEREALDLLGVANPEIASRPLDPVDKEADIQLMYRRSYPEIIAKYMPSIVVADQVNLRANSLSDLYLQGMNFIKRQTLSDRTRFGGGPKLISMGYKLFVVAYNNANPFVYFVAPQAQERHRRLLSEARFKRLPLPESQVSEFRARSDVKDRPKNLALKERSNDD